MILTTIAELKIKKTTFGIEKTPNPKNYCMNNNTTVQQIKVAIADDHKIFRDGIRMALREKEYLKILWEAEDGKDLMHKLKLKLPDVI